MSDAPETGSLLDWHEAPSVTITRLICQFALSIGVLSGCLWVSVAHPEDAGSAALAAGVVIGAWFGIVRERSPRR